MNKTPITYSTNREIGGVVPSQYLTKIEKKGQVSPSVLDGYLRTHLIDTGDIRADRFDDFFIKRSTAILNEIEKATGKTVSGRDSDLVIRNIKYIPRYWSSIIPSFHLRNQNNRS